MYQLVGNVRSRAFRVLWMLEETGLDYTHVPAGPRSEEVRELSPLGKVPVLVADGQAIPDSSAIMTFLADRHDVLTYPAGSLKRAHQDAWLHRINDECDALLWTAARHSFILPEDQRVAEVKPSLKAEFARNLARMAKEIEGPFLMGEQMTVPDILLTHCLNWSINARFGLLEGAMQDYRDRLVERPAFKRVMEMAP